jgi:hypothetical protein
MGLNRRGAEDAEKGREIMRAMLLAGMLMLVAGGAWAAEIPFDTVATSGTCSIVLREPVRPGRGVTWIVTATANTSGSAQITMPQMDGIITAVITNPDGTDAPTSYTLALLDEDGLDLLDPDGAGSGASLGVNRSPTISQRFTPYTVDAGGNTLGPMPVGCAPTLRLTSMGSGKKTVVRIKMQ